MKQPRRIPGIENREHRKAGKTTWSYRVRWIDPATGRRLSEEFDTQADAADYLAALRLARRGAGLERLSAGRETLAEYAEAWWIEYAQHNLARATLANYSRQWNKYALPRLGHLELRAVTPGVMSRFRADLEVAGVGAPTIRMTMAVVQSMLRRAVEEDKIQSNPVAAVRKPRAPRQRAIAPMAPSKVEALRGALSGADGVLVSVLAYAGLRPEEALALEWRHVRRDTLLVEQKVIDGQIEVGQKTRRPPRTVDLLAALRADLAAFQLALGRPTSGLIFPAPDGGAWRETRYRNWRRRTFQPAAAMIFAQGPLGAEGAERSAVAQEAERRRSKPKGAGSSPVGGSLPRPYDLRHSFASLLIHEGRLSVVEIAAQLGHSPAMLLATYSHVLAELRGQPKVSADEQIAQARRERMRGLG